MSRGTLCALACLLTGACIGNDPGPGEPAEDCSGQGLPADAAGLAMRPIALGTGLLDGSFAAWGDGDTVPLITGGQGAIMVTPDVRVESASGDDDPACWRVEIEHYNADGTPYEDEGEGSGALRWVSPLRFDRDGDGHFAGPIYDQMYSAYEGMVLELRTTVVGPDFAGSASVTITLGQ